MILTEKDLQMLQTIPQHASQLGHPPVMDSLGKPVLMNDADMMPTSSVSSRRDADLKIGKYFSPFSCRLQIFQAFHATLASLGVH